MQTVNLSTYFSGMATMYFIMLAAYVFVQPSRTRFQSVLGWTFVVWAVMNFKDIILSFPELYTRQVLNYIMVVDGWTGILYTIFILELTAPGWTTWRKIALLSIPWALFTVAYVVWPTDGVLYAYVAFLWCYAWSIVVIAFVKVRRYLRYIRTNYSNIDDIDISWLKYVFLFFIVGQLAWLATSLAGSALIDVVYYVVIILMWQVTLYYSWNVRPITIEPLPAEPQPAERGYAFADELERLLMDKQLYLNPNLTLNDLAALVHTNRTYVSSYFNSVKGKPFYDYINQLRIEQKSLPLMEEHPEFKLEYIAAESGFQSISTFRRAFHKLKGMSPSQYRQQ